LLAHGLLTCASFGIAPITSTLPPVVSAAPVLTTPLGVGL